MMKKIPKNFLPDAKIVLLGEEHSGRDEMNLAGNPFGLLQAASKNGQNLVRYTWKRVLPNGRTVDASWEVTGHPELGLPGPVEEVLYLVLLQITRESADENGIWPQTVYFSRYELLKRMGLRTRGEDYRVLHDAFKRLTGVNINAAHSFWNARSKSPYALASFHVLDNAYLTEAQNGKVKKSKTNPEQETLFSELKTPEEDKNADAKAKTSYFKWNDILYDSFQAGNVRSLALEFALALKSPTARRLFRYLDMMRLSDKPPLKDFEVGLFKLRDRLGMTPYKFTSKVKEKLASAIAELENNGYLAEVMWQKTKKGEETAKFVFGNLGPIETASASQTALVGALAAQETAFPQTGDGQIAPETAKQGFEGESTLERAARVYEVWNALPDEEKTRLLDEARSGVAPIFWDRIDNPQSPISLSLWDLVEERMRQPEPFPEEVSEEKTSVLSQDE